MPTRRPKVALAVAGWVAAAALTGVVAWRAVAVLDADGPQAGLLSSAEVAAALTQARASATAAPTPAGPTGTPTDGPTDGPTTSPTAAPSTPVAQQVRTWPVTGGEVSASCTGAVITLLAATPADGWTVEVGSAGPEHLEVELHSGEQETTVEAACEAGVPTASVRGEDEDEAD